MSLGGHISHAIGGQLRSPTIMWYKCPGEFVVSIAVRIWLIRSPIKSSSVFDGGLFVHVSSVTVFVLVIIVTTSVIEDVGWHDLLLLVPCSSPCMF